MKKLFSVLLGAILTVSLLMGALTSCTDEKEAKYTAAIGMIASGDYEGAYAAFLELGDYKDTQNYLGRFIFLPTVIEYNLSDRSGVMTVTLGAYNLPCRTIADGTIGKKEGTCIYDNKGNVLRQEVLYDGVLAAFDYTYDENSNQIKAEYSEDGGEVLAVHDFTYNEKGLLTREVYSEGGVVKYDSKETYDENGNLIKSEVTKPTSTSVYTYTYDENGNQIYESYESSKGSWYTITFTYDDDGKLMQVVYTEDDSHYVADYAYDADGNCIREARVYDDGDEKVLVKEFDEHGNAIKETYTESDGEVETVERQFTLTYIPIELHPASRELILTLLEVS